MLSTSQNKLQQNQYLLIAIAILVLLLALASPSLGIIPTFSAGQDLSALSASEISAYRWTEIANFYSSQSAAIPVTGDHLTAFNAVDASAFRWQAMADFFSEQSAPSVKYGPPGR